MKKRLLITFLVSALVGAWESTKGDDREDIDFTDPLARNIGKLYTKDGASHCTGTAVGGPYILTAAHCVLASTFCLNASTYAANGCPPENHYRITRAFAGPSNGKMGWNSRDDYAIYKAERALPVTGAVINISPLKNFQIGTKLSIVGYPVDRNWAMRPVVHRDFSVTHIYGREDFETDYDSFGGSSGSAIYCCKDGRCEIVGVHSGHFAGNSLEGFTQSFARQAREFSRTGLKVSEVDFTDQSGWTVHASRTESPYRKKENTHEEIRSTRNSEALDRTTKEIKEMMRKQGFIIP